MTRKQMTRGVGLVLLLVLVACSSHRGKGPTYHDPLMDFGLIRSVAVVPFANLSIHRQAAERVRDVFMTTLQATVDVYVIPTGEVQRALSRLQIDNPETPTAEEVVRLAGNLEADVVITGTVLEYGPVRSASAESNVISVSAKMMEGQAGRVIWSGASTRGGIGTSERLLGGGGQPMNIVTSQAVEDLLDQMVSQ